jgi:hypothetical protein
MFRARCVPNMYLFGAFSAQNDGEIAPQFPPCWGSWAAHNGPSLQALRRAAVGWVEEYGHLAASDATVGAYDAKKRRSVRLSRRNNSARIDLASKTRPCSDVTGP